MADKASDRSNQSFGSGTSAREWCVWRIDTTFAGNRCAEPGKGKGGWDAERIFCKCFPWIEDAVDIYFRICGDYEKWAGAAGRYEGIFRADLQWGEPSDHTCGRHYQDFQVRWEEHWAGEARGRSLSACKRDMHKACSAGGKEERTIWSVRRACFL